MTRYTKIILSCSNLGILLSSIVICKNSYETYNKCNHIWSIILSSGIMSMLLFFDNLPKIFNDKKIIWTSYCCIPIPYTLIVYAASIVLCIYQISIYSGLTQLCKAYLNNNYESLIYLCISQIINYVLNVILFL